MIINKRTVPFDQIPLLAKADQAYARLDSALQPFYRWKPEPGVFQAIAEARKAVPVDRQTLVQILQEQYQNLGNLPLVKENIESLSKENTFTVTTAHQPSLFLGPLYYIYKAITTILLAKEAEKNLNTKVVPIFIFGSEDHDLEELNHARLFGKKIIWNPGETGAVGSMSTQALQEPLEELRGVLGGSEAAEKLFFRINHAYSGRKNFASATQALLHEFFGRFGLVVLDPNHVAFKHNFSDILHAELFNQASYPLVRQTIESLQTAGFKSQAAPREINLFYLNKQIRERIVREDGVFKVLNTDLVFSDDQMKELLRDHPDRFSPNVVLRPLLQERILPNLAYVGGGGELAYWLERKAVFDYFGMPFPMLVRRNSVLWWDREGIKKFQKFGLDAAVFFQETDFVIRQYIESNALAAISLADEIADLEKVFNNLAQKARQIDPTLEKSAVAEGVKQKGIIEQWQQKLIRVEKQRHEVTVNQIRAFRDKYFPENGLQERSENFLPFILRYGDSFLDALFENLNPFEQGFVVLSEGE